MKMDSQTHHCAPFTSLVLGRACLATRCIGSSISAFVFRIICAGDVDVRLQESRFTIQTQEHMWNFRQSRNGPRDDRQCKSVRLTFFPTHLIGCTEIQRRIVFPEEAGFPWHHTTKNADKFNCRCGWQMVQLSEMCAID